MIAGFKTKIIKQKSFGQKLKLSRLRRELTIEQAEEATKVRARYLEAFETDDFDSLPDLVYALGFLKRYLEFLNLPEDRFLDEFKRSEAAWRSLKRQGTITPENTVHEPKFVITPRMILGSGASLVVLVIVSYIWLQVRLVTAPPQLQILTPSASTKVAIERIEVTGRTDPGAIVAINEQVIPQDKAGNFKETVALEQGINSITISSTNRFNKKNQQTIQILRTEIPNS